MGMTTSGKNAEDVLDMCAILFGEEFLENNAGFYRSRGRSA